MCSTSAAGAASNPFMRLELNYDGRRGLNAFLHGAETTKPAQLETESEMEITSFFPLCQNKAVMSK